MKCSNGGLIACINSKVSIIVRLCLLGARSLTSGISLTGESDAEQRGGEAHEYDANPREWKEAQSKQLIDGKSLGEK